MLHSAKAQQRGLRNFLETEDKKFMKTTHVVKFSP